MATLVDTSALVALLDASEPEHEAVLAAISDAVEVLLIPTTVLPEADFVISSHLGTRASLAMLRSVVIGEFRMEPFTPVDLERCVELLAQYADSNIGLVDASIAAIAERLRITRILTLDRRHFRMLRPRHCAAFDLVP